MISDITQFQQQYQAAVLSAGPATNGSYIGNVLADNFNTSTALLAPNYVSPRSVQMNIGMQREIRRGMVASVDYLRNISTHNFLILDTNHVGDARFFNKAAAQAAISATNAQFGCADVACDIAAGANITNFASNGLDSGYVLCGGSPCAAAAFPGINNAVGSNEMLFPIGQSVYNALQATVKEDVARPFPPSSTQTCRFLIHSRDMWLPRETTISAPPQQTSPILTAISVPTPSIALTRFPSGAIWICPPASKLK